MNSSPFPRVDYLPEASLFRISRAEGQSGQAAPSAAAGPSGIPDFLGREPGSFSSAHHSSLKELRTGLSGGEKKLLSAALTEEFMLVEALIAMWICAPALRVNFYAPRALPPFLQVMHSPFAPLQAVVEESVFLGISGKSGKEEMPSLATFRVCFALRLWQGLLCPEAVALLISLA